ncbi:MAG: hypothetical protein ACRESZ_22620 [Methylococcales bacterium]
MKKRGLVRINGTGGEEWEIGKPGFFPCVQKDQTALPVQAQEEPGCRIAS